ncbi:hypothetical protein [Clostridium sp. C2-6-12]|uniref:hypothetical protein n=1 Tax=Clostridium sp. C2-6-12 TaxID=2698832 RepID=UPI0013686423|nr:hypothetical protein [Clostridium sp. C2-6-12]
MGKGADVWGSSAIYDGLTSYYRINNQALKFKIADKVRLMFGVNCRSEGADNYTKKYVDHAPKKQILGKNA